MHSKILLELLVQGRCRKWNSVTREKPKQHREQRVPTSAQIPKLECPLIWGGWCLLSVLWRMAVRPGNEILTFSLLLLLQDGVFFFIEVFSDPHQTEVVDWCKETHQSAHNHEGQPVVSEQNSGWNNDGCCHATKFLGHLHDSIILLAVFFVGVLQHEHLRSGQAHSPTKAQ